MSTNRGMVRWFIHAIEYYTALTLLDESLYTDMSKSTAQADRAKEPFLLKGCKFICKVTLSKNRQKHKKCIQLQSRPRLVRGGPSFKCFLGNSTFFLHTQLAFRVLTLCIWWPVRVNLLSPYCGHTIKLCSLGGDLEISCRLLSCEVLVAHMFPFP